MEGKPEEQGREEEYKEDEYKKRIDWKEMMNRIWGGLGIEEQNMGRGEEYSIKYNNMYMYV